MNVYIYAYIHTCPTYHDARKIAHTHTNAHYSHPQGDMGTVVATKTVHIWGTESTRSYSYMHTHADQSIHMHIIHIHNTNLIHTIHTSIHIHACPHSLYPQGGIDTIIGTKAVQIWGRESIQSYLYMHNKSYSCMHAK